MLRTIRIVGPIWLCQTVGWGFTFDMPAVLGRMLANDLDLPIEVIFSGLSIMMLSSALVSPFVARQLARRGPATVLAIGTAGMATGLALLAISENAVGYFSSWVLIGCGAAFGLSGPAMAAIVEREPPERARAALSWFLILTALTTTVSWPVVLWITAMVGWRLCCAIGAGALLFLCLPTYLWMLPRPLRRADGVPAEMTASPRLPPALERPVFLLVAIASSALTLLTLGFSPMVHEVLGKAGATGSQILQLNTLRGFASVSARFFEISLGRRLDTLTVGMIACAALLLAFGYLLLDAPGALIAFAILLGLGAGLGGIVRSILPLRTFPIETFGRNVALLALPQNLVLAGAPILYAGLLDQRGMTTLLVFCVTVALVAAIALLALRVLLARPMKRD